MQKELEATYPVLRIQLFGINAVGQESGNQATTQGRELPWLQDVDTNQDSRADAAALWNANFRSVYVLDADNVQVASFDVDAKDLEVPTNFAALRQLLIDAAMTSQKPWRNADDPLDVNTDDKVEPLDALIIINKLNEEGPHKLPPPQAGDPPMRFYDCNGDGEVAPVDALNVINHLNGQSASANAEGEGEREPGLGSWAPMPPLVTSASELGVASKDAAQPPRDASQEPNMPGANPALPPDENGSLPSVKPRKSSSTESSNSWLLPAYDPLLMPVD